MEKIPTPEGLEVDAQEGVYEGLATFKVLDGGNSLQLVDIDGVSVSGKEAEEEDEDETESGEGSMGAREQISNYVTDYMKGQQQ